MNNNLVGSYFDVVRTSLKEIGYKDDNDTLALHILNVVHVVNITSVKNPDRTPIYMAAIWLDNLVLNVIGESTGLLDPVFMHDQEQKILYVVHHDYPIKFAPLLYVQKDGMLDVWQNQTLVEKSIDNLTIANIWYMYNGDSEEQILHDDRHDKLHVLDGTTNHSPRRYH